MVTLPAMYRHLRPRSPLLLRLLMLALVGLSVFGSSLASALTDIHMLAHADVGVDVHEHDDAALESVPDEEDRASALLHALVHCVHCHGHSSVLPMSAAAWVVAPPPPQWINVPGTAQQSSQPPESLFRPPIAA